MEIRLYLNMLRKGWWIILLSILVAINATLIYSFMTTPIYRTTAKFLVSPNMNVISTGDQALNSLDTLDKRSVVGTYAEFLNSDKVYSEALIDLNLDPQSVLEYKRTAVIMTDARVLELTVEGPNAKLAADLANAIGEKGITYIRKFYQVYDINPLDNASVPTSPISPQPVRDSALALIFGLVLGSALAILNEQIRIPVESLRQRRLLDNESNVFARRHFDRLLELELVRSKARSDVFSLGLVRLDGLVEYIDKMPQVLTQRILQNVTRNLKNELKGTDVIGRWDKATFAILLPSTPYNAANNLMGRVRQKLSIPVDTDGSGETIPLNPYVGVARSRDDELVSDFIARTQKDLDGNFFNVPVPPPPASKPISAPVPQEPAPVLSPAAIDTDILDSIEMPSSDVGKAIDTELDKARKQWKNPNKP